MELMSKFWLIAALVLLDIVACEGLVKVPIFVQTLNKSANDSVLFA